MIKAVMCCSQDGVSLAQFTVDRVITAIGWTKAVNTALRLGPLSLGLLEPARGY
jgi:hypothetical protein